MIVRILLLMVLLNIQKTYADDYNKLSDISSFKSALEASQHKFKSIYVDFKEYTFSSIYKESLKSTGKLYYLSPDKIRWEHITPSKRILLIDKSDIMYFDNGKEINNQTIKLAIKRTQNLMFKLLNNAYFDSKYFSILYLENKKNYKVILTPVNGRVSRNFKSIELVYNKQDLTLKELSLIESKTDKIEYQFSNTIINPTLDTNIFKKL